MNSLDCLSQVSDFEFVVLSILSGEDAADTERFVTALGMEHVSVHLRSSPWQSRVAGVGRFVGTLIELLADKYFFIFERVARKQKHIDDLLQTTIRESRPDLIIFDHIYTALCTPSVFSLGIPCALISVNHEVAFHRTTKAQGGPVGEGVLRRMERWIYRNGNWLSNLRFESHVARLYERCVGIVTLNPNDIPKDLPDSIVRAAIPPVFKKSSWQWGYRGNRSMFFVGNIWIYSNRLAIHWICTRLAPELWKLDEGVRINIIGARADQVPASWPKENTSFMGYASKVEVDRQMCSADLFIAPIENPFGAKLKISECVSHATPFLATDAAMSGLAFREDMPRIDLASPAAAAKLALEYISKPQMLVGLSRSIDEYAQEARSNQVTAWSGFLIRCARAGQ